MTTLATAEPAQLISMRAKAQADALIGIKSHYKIYETLAGGLLKPPRIPEPIRKRACANALRIAQARG
jgi:hypothetical protein